MTAIMPIDPTDNLAVSLALGCLASIVIIILGRPIETYLRLVKHLQSEQPGPSLRFEPSPAMGGVAVTLTMSLITLVFNVVDRLSILLPLGIMIAATILGAVEDRLKVGMIDQKRQGIAARHKFLWLVVFATITSLILWLPESYGLGLHQMYVPFFGPYNIGILHVPIGVLAIMGMANSVNITDDSNELVAVLGSIAFLAYGIIAHYQSQVGLVTFCFTMVGALLGFLWFNAPHAQLFLGNTGSLAIGATLATVAFMTGQWLVLPVIGFVFYVESLSLIVQVLYFNRTKRKTGTGVRLLRIAPLHSHLLLNDWSPSQIVARFAILGVLTGFLGVGLVLL